MNREFWAGRRVFVTGHSGFKGSWLMQWLERLGAEPAGFSLPDDVRDKPLLAERLREHRPAVVFHMAAQALVRTSYALPADTFATNIMGTVNVLEVVREVPSVRATVVVTSDKVYENRELDRGYRESDPLGGYDPYSSSKACAELAAGAYRRSYGLMLATARAGNVIGGGDWSTDRLVPDCIRAFQAGQPVVLRHPDAVRPWQHVLEPLAGYLLLAEKLHEGEPGLSPAYNFGPSDLSVRTVRELVQELARLWGAGASYMVESDGGPAETHRLLVNSALARRELQWQPRLSFAATLAWTVEWYRRHAAGECSAGITLRQIKDYEALL